MMNPAAMAIVAITVMLWILWSDTLRARRPMPILYALRIALYLIVTGILILNLVRSPDVFAGTTRILVIVAVLVGLLGAGYFARRRLDALLCIWVRWGLAALRSGSDKSRGLRISLSRSPTADQHGYPQAVQKRRSSGRTH